MQKRIPKEIQRKVEFNLDIADEIYNCLSAKGLKPVDLAKRLNKSESEISKWLTGTHNFTIKTIMKIEAALGIEILSTRSARISEYETIIADLLQECKELRKEKEGVIVFYATLGQKPFSFKPLKADHAKIKTNTKPSEIEIAYD